MQAWLLIPLALAFFFFRFRRRTIPTLPKFELPIDCEFPKGCYIQSYVDLDPSEGTIDYQCGIHTYNGHKGTDFRLRKLSMLEKGVRVLAAAPGRVARIRDGMPDTHMKVFGKKVLSRFGAGNAVVIDHGNKWVTLYAHLKKGSIRVRPGDIVKAGQTLGLVGLSGLTEFPHLHFEISHRDRIVDAFVGSRPSVGCPSDRQPMWSATALKKIGYQRSFVMRPGSRINRLTEKLCFSASASNSNYRKKHRTWCSILTSQACEKATFMNSESSPPRERYSPKVVKPRRTTPPYGFYISGRNAKNGPLGHRASIKVNSL